MKPLLGSLAIAAAVILAGVALKDALATRALEAAVAANDTRRHALEADIAQLQQQLARADRATSAATESAAEDTTAPAAAKPVAKPAAVPSGPMVDALVNDAGFQNLDLAARRAKLATTYTALFEQLGLSAEQQRQFEDLILGRYARQLDLFAIRQGDTAANDPAVIARYAADADAALTTAAKALLGEPGYAAWQEYDRSLPARAAVDTFAGKAAVMGQPLTPAQADQLTQLLAQTSPAFVAGGRVDAVDWNAAAAVAPQVLTREQAAVFSGAFAPDAYLQRIQRMADGGKQ